MLARTSAPLALIAVLATAGCRTGRWYDDLGASLLGVDDWREDDETICNRKLAQRELPAAPRAENAGSFWHGR